MKLQKPVIREEYLQRLPDAADAIQQAAETETALENLRIHDFFLAGEDLSGLRFQSVLFENCRLSRALMQKISFVDVRFVNCDLSNCKMNDAYFHRCEFLSCKGTGAAWEGSTLKQVLIRDSN
ncbi:MAG: pentapeptide repeat-containing protein, partial [Lachnospiraceae bacterium]|nr:pentapeptide repeat-containing protein [Lachnospiraceae bacterium]